ncbi:MAG: phosphoribosylformylglycinamidine synthase subunit PurL, partial [Nocardioidaceae bacterium]|nr:phosphoribosylformylglycinamidine synthase subunit PurL [Nocardioidaceae bacterium]
MADTVSETASSSPKKTALDTVAAAAEDPNRAQPWAELGLKSDEYDRIREILGRRPTGAELAMYSVMWSEHCSYKSSKVHLKQFGELAQETPVGPMLAGIGENAGVIDIGQGYAVSFKVESHNHPSYVEPYQGAATGVGGIVRDIIAMGARPVAVMDPLRFGPLDAPDTRRVLPGIVAGVGGYGNCLGLPNIGGETVFDQTYLGNPLVNALCVGVLRHEDLHLAKASGDGNLVVLYGARTGGDGIGGVSVLASETFDADGPAKRPSVQVGDPFMEKLLIECTLELFSAGVVAGIQDLGGAGLSCATSELASAGDGGMFVHLDRVPLRDSTLSPEEILMSESQERMMAVVEPGDIDAFLAITGKWDVEAAVIGEVTETGRLVVDWHDETVVDVPPRTVAHDGPVYERPFARPDWQDALQADGAESLARPSNGEELRATLLQMVASPNLCDKSWITDQYDRYVQGNTVLAQPADSGMIRVDDQTHLGVSVATDCNGRFAKLDPYAGAQLALSEAYRNVATGGATPLAVSDCLNFGSPEDTDVMWQFAQACKG